MTSYARRLNNLPAVLDTIYHQTLPPDLVVVNLAHDEVVPENVMQYLESHHVEVNRVEDTKVYKKFLPTLKKYPEDCIICIDDDWLYHSGMIEDFMDIHCRYPNNPICGTDIISSQTMSYYHNGWAALVKLCYFEGLLDNIDADLIEHCPSSDYVFTYFANKAGHPYIRTKQVYYVNTMQRYEEGFGYTVSFQGASGPTTWAYLEKRFGRIDNNLFAGFIIDPYMATIVSEINDFWKMRYNMLVKTTTYKLALKMQKIIGKIKK